MYRVSAPGEVSPRDDNAELEVFFDGDCPLCRREIRWLQGRDRAGKIRFTDIAQPSGAWARTGLSQQQLMSEIYARTADGQLLRGVETLQRVYELVGFRPLVELSRLWGVRHIVGVAYELWARNRLRLTGRCSADVCAAKES